MVFERKSLFCGSGSSGLRIGALKGMNVSSGHVSVIQMKGEMSLCVLGG